MAIVNHIVVYFFLWGLITCTHPPLSQGPARREPSSERRSHLCVSGRGQHRTCLCQRRQVSSPQAPSKRRQASPGACRGHPYPQRSWNRLTSNHSLPATCLSLAFSALVVTLMVRSKSEMMTSSIAKMPPAFCSPPLYAPEGLAGESASTGEA